MFFSPDIKSLIGSLQMSPCFRLPFWVTDLNEPLLAGWKGTILFSVPRIQHAGIKVLLHGVWTAALMSTLSGTSKITSQTFRFHTELLPHHQGRWKNSFGVLTRTLLIRRDPHYNENEEHLMELTLDWSPSYKFMLLSDCSPWACSQLSFNLLFCDPLNKTRPRRSGVFWMR